MEEDYIKKLYDTLIGTDADVSMCYYDKFYKKYKKNNHRRSKEIKVYTAKQAIEQLCYQRYFNHGPYVKLWKKETIGNIRFPVGVGYEDMATIYKYMANANKIALLDKTLYYYRQRKGSTMRKKFSLKKLDRMHISEEILEFIKERYPDIESAAIARLFLSNLQVIMELPYKKEYQNEWKVVKNNIRYNRKSVLMDKKAKKEIRIMAACSYMGMGTLKVLGVTYNFLINKNIKC